MVEIAIDSCQNPFECKKCIQACPFNVVALDPVELESHEVVKKWKVIAIFKELCNGCGRCVEACPEGRITIREEGEVNWARCTELIREDQEFQEYLEKGRGEKGLR